jgi:redox-sensitive bicupin YhaK (pirin superfamily)
MAEKTEVAAEECVALGDSGATILAFPNLEVTLGGLRISRALPVRGRRLVGPWCFLDRFGPLTFGDDKPMDVAPHPHIGLQTVTWLLDGEILHNDSLGCEAEARPGGVNVMTAASGIAHAEQTPLDNRHRLDGVQLWVALPDTHRNTQPNFESFPEVPAVERPGGIVRVFSGSLDGLTSPASHFSELVGADLLVHRGHSLAVAVSPRFEHALLVLNGDCQAAGVALDSNHLHYLGCGRTEISLRSTLGCCLLLIGGPPFPEKILMWWNFVARNPGEMAAARADWEAHRRFGDVHAYRGPRLEAPSLIRFAQPNPMS